MKIKTLSPLGNLVTVKGKKDLVRTELFFLTNNGFRIYDKDGDLIKFEKFVEDNYGDED